MSLGRGAATITLLTALSRLTGFVRVVAVAAAMGTTFLANTYQSANTAPNLVFELVAAGVLTSVFVPTFVEHLVTGRAEDGWDAANVLTSAALVALTGLAVVLALGAPIIMSGLLAGVDDAVRDDSVRLGTTFLRLFAPQVIFYGAGMIMTGALHAHRRFALPAMAPIFNNLIVIAVYVTYTLLRGDDPAEVGSVSSGEAWLLGAGTTFGVVVMTVCLVPSLKQLGWGFRFKWDPGHPAVRRGARLGVWALGYAGGYQAGLVVVLILANRVEGGVAAYQWAYTFFFLPHALFGVPIFNVLFTAMSEHVARGENAGVARRLDDGLAMLAFILLPMSVALLVLSGSLASLTLRYGAMTAGGAELVGQVLAAFAVGLPAFSAFLVLTRAFYALGDTKTPALMNALTVLVATVIGTMLFFQGEGRGSVPGLALGHSAGFLVGSVVIWVTLRKRLGQPHPRLGSSLARSSIGAGIAGLAMFGAHAAMSGDSRTAALMDVGLTSVAGFAAYLAVMQMIRSPELSQAAGVARSFLDRRSS
jgi:putative peptidoglycan lipid II flippase